MERAELLVDCRNHHGEGVFWNPADSRLWWTDIHGKRLWWHEPATGRSDSIPMRDRVCCFAPRQSGGFIVAFAQEIAFLDPVTGDMQSLHSFEPGKPGTRMNDGRTDRQGRLVAGGMRESGEVDSSVIRVDADGSVTTLLDGIGCANSICFTPDGRNMYFTDSFVGDVWAFAYDIERGVPGERRLLNDFETEPGIPDGSCVDAEGALWNAEWDGRRVIRILPDGTIDRVVEVPVLRPTCCAFGGENLDVLFITTSRLDMTEAQLTADPTSGGVFSFRPGVVGVVDAPFAG